MSKPRKKNVAKPRATDTAAKWNPSPQAIEFARLCVHEAKIELLERLVGLINETIAENRVVV